jgi:hypothetical protein
MSEKSGVESAIEEKYRRIGVLLDDIKTGLEMMNNEQRIHNRANRQER